MVGGGPAMSTPSESMLEAVLFQRLSVADRQETVNEILQRLSETGSGSQWVGAVTLAARLLNVAPNDDQQQRLVAAILLRLRSLKDIVTTQELCGLLERQDHIRLSVFDGIGKHLTSTAAALCNTDDEDAFVVPSQGFVAKHLAVQSVVSIVPTDQESAPLDTVTSYMAFVSTYLGLSRINLLPSGTSEDLLRGVLVFTGARSQSLCIAARDLSVSLLPLLFASDSTTVPCTHTAELIFDRIRDLLSIPQPSRHANIASRIWFQWMFHTSSDASGELQAFLSSVEYWQLLQRLLHLGHSEERKFGLSVLQLSLSYLKEDISNTRLIYSFAEATEYRKNYGKYCVLFQTIVLGRYQNQVDECLPDLESLICSGKVHYTWIETLLKSVFHRDVQETIRKSVGNWYMDLASRQPRHFSRHHDFMTASLLPWATTGVLFTSSTVQANRGAECLHGERLSTTIANLVKGALPAQKEEFVQSILTYLEAKGDKIYHFAMAYILEGINEGVRGDDVVYVDVELCCKLALMSGNREIPRDLMTAYCMSLAEARSNTIRYIQGPATQTLNDRLKNLLEVPNHASHARVDLLQITSFGDLRQQIIDTKYQSLAGKGLSEAVTNVERFLPVSIDTQSVLEDAQVVLEAIWDETETQDYQREVIMRLPSIFLHPSILQLKNPELLALSKKALHQLYNLADGRIYMLYPVLSSVRLVALSVPQCIEALAIPDLLAKFAKNPPLPRVEFLIEVSLAEKLHQRFPRLSWESYYGPRESSAYACMFDLLNRLQPGMPHYAFAGALLDTLLAPWTSQTPPIPIVMKWKKTEQLQMMLILTESVLPTLDTTSVNTYLNKFLGVLSMEPLPRYRFILEWIILRIFLTYPALRPLLLNLIRDQTSPKHTASLIKMAIKVAAFPDSTEDFAVPLMALLVALAASSKVAIRHEAQWSVPLLWNQATAAGWTQITTNTAVVALNDHVHTLDKYNQPNPARLLEAFDPVNDHTLSNLFSGNYFAIEPAELPIVEPADFEAICSSDTQTSTLSTTPPPCMPLGPPISSTAIPTIKPIKPLSDAITTADSSLVPTALQTKGLALSAPPLTSTSPKHPLILCASLIDNPYNLGGLSRLAEIFACSTLLVPDLTLTTTPRFTSVAVTSHLHIPLAEVTPDALVSYLQERKRDGYTVVGVEQTDQSLVLGDVRDALPEKCVLVMGSEKEGIPARILVECGVCVEIRQWGVTRSLNVQTAAAVVLFEWGRRWGRR